MTDANSGARVYHVCYGFKFGKFASFHLLSCIGLGIAHKTAA